MLYLLNVIPVPFRSLLLFIALLTLWHLASGQAHTNKGTEFWAGYGLHQFMEPGQTNSQEMQLLITAEQPAVVKVTISGTSWVRTYNIPANTSIQTEYIPKAGFYDARLYSVPPSFGGTGGEGVFSNKGLHIESNVPVVVNAQIFGSTATGAATLLPVNTWGYSYTTLNADQHYDDDTFSWIFAVASADNTVIEITPSAPTRNGRVPGVPFTVTLNKGQIFQLVGAGLGSRRGHDLTGTKVRSIPNVSGQCHPIGVFSGSSRTAITCDGAAGNGDNIIQQVYPEQAWGKQYLTAPFSTETGVTSQPSIYRVLVKDPTTVVRRNGVVLGGLVNNTYYQYQSNTADYIEADKPVLVAQYMVSSGSCSIPNGLGDPDMVYVSPLLQGVKNTVFQKTGGQGIQVHYLTLIVPVKGMPSLLIDGSSTFDRVYPHLANPAFNVVEKRWTAVGGAVKVSCDEPFTGTVYGLGTAESYAYSAGASVFNLTGTGTFRNSANNSTAQNDFTCVGTPVLLSVLLPFQPTALLWKLSAAGTAATPNADVTQNAPIAAATEIINGQPWYRYTLPAACSFNTAGDYYIPVTATTAAPGCDNQVETVIPIAVKAAPDATISISHPTACSLDTVYLSGNAVANGHIIDKWNWDLEGGTAATTREAKKVFTAGNHTAGLDVITKEGCVASATQTFTVEPPPTAVFTASATDICENGTVTFTDNGSAYSGGSPLTWQWNTGNATDVTASDAAPQSGTYTARGAYHVKLVTRVSELCISDTARAVVNVSAMPVIKFTVPDKCLPANGEAKFTGLAEADSALITQYRWDFGDGSPQVTEKDPVHKYAAGGTYHASFRVTTSAGCSADSLFDVVVALQPQLSYTRILPVCENTSTGTVAKATVLNGAAGSGIYSGPGIEDDGKLLPALAGSGVHTAKYVYTTTAGCKDSVTASFTVNAVPALQLTLPEGCLPANGEAEFSGSATAADGQAITAYTWNFGDGSPVAASQNATHHYTKAGTYNISYTATTENGCVKDSSSQITVGIAPQLVYNTIPPVCVSEPGPASAAMAGVVNNLSGTGVYSGTGISAAGAFVPATLGTGSHGVKYVFTTTEGCKDSVSSTISVLPVPLASFVAARDTVCVGSELQFTDMSTGGVNSWSWSFGDGSTASTANPSQRFNTTGRFDVSLEVVDAAGCRSAPFSLAVTVTAPPVIDAGPALTVPEGVVVLMRPQTADSTKLAFSWTPAGDFLNPNAFSAALLTARDAVYTLTATGPGNCTASDDVQVTLLRAIKPPNVFSPNGDGINDTWVITGLSYYPDCTVDVFNRSGQRIYRSIGYGTPWNGTLNGSPLPVGTYYYVIKPKPGDRQVTGSVTILK